jgi:hypothetical protein
MGYGLTLALPQVGMDKLGEKINGCGIGISKAYALTIAEHAATADSDEEEEEEEEEERVQPFGAQCLYKMLWNRLVAEIMILGCLAFTVWCADQNKTWDFVADMLGYKAEDFTECLEDLPCAPWPSPSPCTSSPRTRTFSSSSRWCTCSQPSVTLCTR